MVGSGFLSAFINTMCRILLFVICSCIVVALCDLELPAQSSEGEVAEREPAPPPATPKPANELARKLLDLATANRLQLDSSQRTQIANTIYEQSQKIASAHTEGATEEHFQAIYKEYEGKLAGILTATQRAVLDKGPSDGHIRINFNGPWREVLQLIADQAGMQLVLDAPPPQETFNFSSLETYTITQTLDFINGILITRGYNLTRSSNRKMLHFINLNAPPSNWSFPAESPDKLEDRAVSEFVSVTHNFSRRVPDTVAAAVKPLGGPFTRTWLAGQNIIVIDRVEIQRRVPGVIRNIRDPDPPQEPRQQERASRPPPPPVWKTYTIDNEKIDPDFVLQTFRQWAGGFRVLRLGDSRTFHISAQTGTHNTHDSLLKRLESDPAVAIDATDAVTPQEDKTIKLYPIVP